MPARSAVRKKQQKGQMKDDDSAVSSSTASIDDTDDEDSPQPVSSDSESSPTEQKELPVQSRLFAPYRSLGLVSSGRPFHVLSHESASTMICLPIGNRIQLLNERLQPTLVAQPIPNEITHVVTDATLSASVVVDVNHTLVLLQRTQVMAQLRVVRNSRATTQALLHLGRVQLDMRGEKEGRKENAAVVGVVLAFETKERDETVPVVGDNDDGEDDDDDMSEDGGDDDDSSCTGQVVIFIVTRTTIQMQRRIRLYNLIPRSAAHPPTYLNKIVVAGHTPQGRPAMSLLNIRSTQIVHEFKCIQTNNLTNKCSITTLEPSPAVDTMAVGTSRGTVQLVNLILDKLLFCVNHKSASGTLPTITSVSFRTDAAALQYQIAPMAVGRSDGTVTVWDLTPDTNQGRSILTELNNIHAGGVAMIQYLPREPLLLSIGTVSNSIVLHIFDNANHTGRILRQRRGHTSPPTVIRYLHAASGGLTAHYDGTDAAACQILSSGGMDRTLRIFSTVRSVLDKEYSQGPALEKRARKLGIEKAELLLPPLISMACSEANRRDWGDLVTIHKDHSFAYVWSTKNGSQSGPILRQSKWNVSAMKDPPPRHTNATSVCMSACGHFALVGTQGGVVYKYNVQSGHARGTYPRNQDTEEDKSRTKRNRAPGDINRTIKALEKNMKLSNRVSNLDRRDTDAEQLAKLDERRQAKLQLASHDGYAVTGLAVDSVNKTLISVGKDKKLVLWHFANHAPHKKSPFLLPAPATKLCHIRESDLAAIAMEDFSVVLFDCTSLSIVRRFGAQGMCHHTAPVSDLGFSPDGRTLYSASFDSTLCVYDVPTNTCVDWLSFKSPVTSLTVSPTGEFLATAHVGQLGLNVWSDRSFYQTVHLSGTPPSKPARMDEPVPISDSNEPVEKKKFAGTDEAQHEEDASNEVDEGPPVPKKQGLVTLSGLPPAHWKNLFHLELVKERNKPKEAPKKPPSAPFFLQWRSGESVGGATDELAARENDAAQSGQKAEEESWAAAWSDDDDGAMMGEPDLKRELVSTDHHKTAPKRLKVSHARSPLANLLQQCDESTSSQCQIRYQQVTEHVATLGPSGIDLALSSLCNGTHDLDQGLPLLQMACSWLIEACRSGERFEAVNAYLHRFLYLHAPVLAEIEREGDSRNTNGENDQESRRKQLLESVSHLKEAQRIAFEALNNKTQHTLCLLRHVSRMV